MLIALSQIPILPSVTKQKLESKKTDIKRKLDLEAEKVSIIKSKARLAKSLHRPDTNISRSRHLYLNISRCTPLSVV